MEINSDEDHSINTRPNLKIRFVRQKKKRIKISGISSSISAGIYLLKVNNRNTRTRCVICSKLTIKTPERRH